MKTYPTKQISKAGLVLISLAVVSCLQQKPKETRAEEESFPQYSLEIAGQQDLGYSTSGSGSMLGPIYKWRGGAVEFRLVNIGTETIHYTGKGPDRPALAWKNWTGSVYEENTVDYWCGTGQEPRTLAAGEMLEFRIEMWREGDLSAGIELRFDSSKESVWVWSNRFSIVEGNT